MEFTIRKFRIATFLVKAGKKNYKEKKFQGYSFIDKYGGTIMIAYGEKRRDYIAKELEEGKEGYTVIKLRE